MRLLSSAPRVLLIFCLTAALAACEKKGGKSGPAEPPAPKPTAFYDTSGEMWTCVETDESASVTGQVNFSRQISLSRADVLHISLLEITGEDQLELVSTLCMNNLLSTPVPYQINYNPELINPDSRYVLSSVFFTAIDGTTFLASYRPDGFLEVINNGVVDKANISLKVP